MKGLRVSRDLTLPLDVAGEAIAILAKRGAGKTNTATVLVEEMVGAGVQVVVLDPVGAWWGLRSSHDGKSAGLPVPIIGGAHGDTPLEPTAGALIADVAVDTGQSLLVDLSDFPSKEAHRRFVTDFAERLFKRKARAKSLLHLVLEEADQFAPQQGRADTARMRGAIEQLVRLGRSRGIGVTMITQRSASLNKDILTQADVLIAMRTGGPHDRQALRAWVDSRGDEHADEVMDSLPGLATGEAWIWNPERDLLKRARVRLRETFDSSATPKAGEHRAEPKAAASIDLAKLGDQILATAEKTKASDPAELKKRIRELERELARAESRAKVEERIVEVEKPVDVPVLADGQLEFLRAIGRELQEAASRASQTADEILTEVARIGERPRAEPRRTERATTAVQRSPSGPASEAVRRAPAPVRATDAGLEAAGGVRDRPTGQALLDQWLRHPRMGEGERRVLLALIDLYPNVPGHEELCDLTGYSPSASTMGVILSKLRKLGLVEKGERRIAARVLRGDLVTRADANRGSTPS